MCGFRTGASQGWEIIQAMLIKQDLGTAKGFFENFQPSPPSFLMISPPPPTTLGEFSALFSEH